MVSGSKSAQEEFKAVDGEGATEPDTSSVGYEQADGGAKGRRGSLNKFMTHLWDAADKWLSSFKGIVVLLSMTLLAMVCDRALHC